MSRIDRNRECFIRHRPWLCHVSLATDVASIHKHGLLSTSSLLDLFEVPETDRQLYEREPRSKAVTLVHSLHGRTVLNDQAPLHAGGLSRCLDGMTSEEWCRELNSRVYLRPVRDRSQCIWKTKLTNSLKRLTLVADTREFLAVYEEELAATSINPGYTLRDPTRRGRYTFTPLRELFDAPSLTMKSIAELSVLHKVNRTDLFETFPPEVSEA